jgi:nanoRNase/pAp phosphatase (c-di-AMP/oligoRNAs hydrolase)
MVILEFNNYKFGALITEFYRSEVGNYLANKYIDSVDFILIYDPFRKSFSLRSQKENINLNEITKIFSKTGGGHKKSAGFPLKKANKWIINKIIKEQIKK